jgi:hypothetical protein
MSRDRCDERRLVSSLAGDLDTAEAADFDAHLLACEACWAAVVGDRRGAGVAQSLREEAPAALRERLAGSFGAAPPGPRRRHRARVAVALAAALGVVAAVAGVVVGGGARAADPAPVAAVVRLAGSPTAWAGGAAAMHVWRATSPAGGVVVAESAAPFPMPAGARTLQVGGSQAWVARRGRVHLLCVMAPKHALLAGPVPDAELAAVARAYGLVG